MLEYMDCLDEKLNGYLMQFPEWVWSEILEINRFIKQVKILKKKMGFLRYLYVSEINVYVNHEKLEGLETRIQFMADNRVISVISNNCIFSELPYLLCLIVLMELEMKKIFLGELKDSKFTQSKTFKNKKFPKRFSHHLHSLLMYLRNKNLENFPNNVSARNIDVTIEFLLVVLDDDGSNHAINGNMLNEILEKALPIVGDVLYVIQKLLPRSINQDDTSNINVCLIHILEKTEDLKAQVETYYKSLKFTPSKFPTVGGLSFLDSLLRTLNKMLKSESGLVFMMKPHFGNLEKELSSLTSSLEKELSSLSSISRDVAKVHHEHTINLAYEAEVAIDCILALYDVYWHSFCSLPTILKEIKHINAEVTEMWSADVALKPCYMVAPSKYLPTQHSNPVTDEEIVGFGNATEKMIQYLIRGTNVRDVIPIVGMGGQGKTTIARKVYNDDMIVSRFDVRAWCIISQTYNRRELLQEIFSQATGSKDKGDMDDILADKLNKSLMRKRYLIVLDDMWDGMAWDDLIHCFPDDGNRSRIIVTTRLQKVGEHVKRHTDLYFLPCLTPDESCRLLQKKVFQQEGCPAELQDVSLEIAEKCKGLPLEIILVAGTIKKKKMEASWWHEVKKSLLSYLGESKGYGLSTMKLSYDNLPDYLRPCLLYMGMFPEDARIPVSKLISLWIAEGFVQNIESGRLEETAEDYLMDLISRNVVMVSKREYNGKVKYCQVHDVVLHFCLEKSREEKFMLAVKSSEIQFQASYWKGSRISFSAPSKFASLRYIGKPFHKNLRSLITTNLEDSDWNPFHLYAKMTLLKVLDLSSHKVEYLSSVTFQPLIRLRYLAVYTRAFNIHEESHLFHLETLIVKCLSSRTLLPTIFWKMEKLRRVEIPLAVACWKEGSPKLENLRILRNVYISPYEVDCLNVLGQRCPNLQELDITVMRGDSCERAQFNLESFPQLQILRLFVDRILIVSKLYLPLNLKKLVVRADIEESTISDIAELPSLEYLQLWDANSLYRKWCLGDITFHKLKVLKLVKLGISRWDASEESFPLLETLVLKLCDELEEIPLSFADIPTLKQIILINIKNKSLEASAVRIKKEVQDIEGCDRIDIITKDWWGNLKKL